MLQYRICQQCDEEIRSRTAFFCHRCGAELATPPPDMPDSKVVPLQPKKIWRRRELWLGIGAVAVLLVGVVWVLCRDLKESGNEQVEEQPRQVLADSYLIPQFSFGKQRWASLVPREIDFYVESQSPEALIFPLIQVEERAEIEERSGLSLEEIASHLSSQYALIQQASSLAFLASVKSVPVIRDVLEQVGEVGGFQGYLIGDLVVVSNDSELVDAIQRRSANLEVSLGMTSAFSKATRNLPSAGQILVVGNQVPWFLPTTLPGTAWVVYAEGGKSWVEWE